MSLGLSVFLSVLLISIIYLFQKFPNSRKWLKIFSLVIIILPLIALLFGYCYSSYTEYELKKPRQVTEYGSIKLADTLENVRFTEGIPNEQYKFFRSNLTNVDLGKAEIMTNEGDFGTVPLENLSKALQKHKISTKSKSKETFKVWEYQESFDKTKYFIRFTKRNTVGAISCTGDGSYSCPKVASIGINSTWDEVIKIFGSPPYGYTDFDDGKRAVCYPQYNLCFTLEKSKVQFITIKSWEAKDYYYLGKSIIKRWNEDNYKYAVKAFNQVIKLDQAYTKAHIKRGWTLYLLKKYEDAINSYNYVINLGYKSADLYNKLGLALENLNRTGEAMKAFDEALKLDPQYRSAYTNKARLFAQEKEYEKAIVVLDKAIELTKERDKNSFFLSFHLADKASYLSKLNKYEEAIEIYNESIAVGHIPFNNCYAYHEKGKALLALGKNKEAIESINKAIELDPANKEFQKTLQAVNLNEK